MCMEASGTYCMQVMCGKEQREKRNRHRSLDRNFICVLHLHVCLHIYMLLFFVVVLLVYYISEGFKARIESFGENIS